MLSTVIAQCGPLVRSQVSALFVRLLSESMSMDNNHYLAAVSKVIFELGVPECIQNNMEVKSRFSTVGLLPLFELLFPFSNHQSASLGVALRCCIEAINDPRHPFKCLVVCGLKYIHERATESDDKRILAQIQTDLDTTFDLLTFYPFYQDLQSVVFGSKNHGDLLKMIDFYSAAYIKSYDTGNLIDLLLVFLSGLWHQRTSSHEIDSKKIFELGIERLLVLSKGKPSQIAQTYAEYWIETTHQSFDWKGVIKEANSIQQRTSFSEWLFNIFMRATEYCKPSDKECFQALIPTALADPLLIIPILPVVIFCASISPNINFMASTFKTEISTIFDLSYFSPESINIVMNVLQSVFTISTETLSWNSNDCPSWYTQFSVSDIIVLYYKTLKSNMTDLASFFMQLIWSVDKDKISSNEVYDIFVMAKDYKSALGAFSSESQFSTERVVYNFMAEGNHNYAEITLKMLADSSDSKFDAIFLQNHALKSDIRKS